MSQVIVRNAEKSRLKLVIRKQALRAMCMEGAALSKNAQVIAAELRRFCNGSGNNSFPRSPVTQEIDAIATARIAGRREVYDMLVNLLCLPVDTYYKLEDI